MPMLTPFNYFVKKCSFEDKLLNPDRQINPDEFAKLCEESWKKMDDLEKAPYKVTDRENEELRLRMIEDEKDDVVFLKVVKGESKRKNPSKPTDNNNEVDDKKAKEQYKI